MELKGTKCSCVFVIQRGFNVTEDDDIPELVHIELSNSCSIAEVARVFCRDRVVWKKCELSPIKQITAVLPITASTETQGHPIVYLAQYAQVRVCSLLEASRGLEMPTLSLMEILCDLWVLRPSAKDWPAKGTLLLRRKQALVQQAAPKVRPANMLLLMNAESPFTVSWTRSNNPVSSNKFHSFMRRLYFYDVDCGFMLQCLKPLVR